MSFIGTTINQSPTITGKLAADIAGDVSFKAVVFDTNGLIAVGGEKSVAIGFILPGHAPDLKAGDEVTIQIKDIALARTSAAVKAGDSLGITVDGTVAKAGVSTYVIAEALQPAAANSVVRVQITKSGYTPTV